MTVFQAERTARKPRKCSRCGRLINPGERYKSYTIPPGGELGYLGWVRGSEHPTVADCYPLP